MDLNGVIKWKTQKDPLFDKGGFILADDMLIGNDGEGTLYLIEPTPEGFKVLSKAKLLDTKNELSDPIERYLKRSGSYPK